MAGALRILRANGGKQVVLSNFNYPFWSKSIIYDLLFHLAEYGPPAVVAVILADTGKDSHIFVGNGEVKLDVGFDVIRLG